MAVLAAALAWLAWSWPMGHVTGNLSTVLASTAVSVATLGAAYYRHGIKWLSELLKAAAR